MKESSFLKRYLSKFIANIITLVFNIGITLIVPRTLGPSCFGRYEFITTFFQRLSGFLLLGTDSAFYVKCSKRQSEYSLVGFYLIFLAVTFLIVIVFVFLSLFFSFESYIWPGEGLRYIFLGAVFGFFYHTINNTIKIYDAYGFTLYSETIRILNKFLSFFVIITIFLLNQLNLLNYFIFVVLSQLLLIISLFLVLIIKSDIKSGIFKITFSLFKKYCIEFYKYSNPLFITSIFGLIFGIANRWFLQYWAGSIQQGFFGLGQRVAIIVFLFVSAMIPLMTRKLAELNKEEGFKKITNYFRKNIFALYSITTMISCFFFINSKYILYMIGANKYSNASNVVAIMVFVPLHQVYGQACSSLLFATEKTKLYRSIDIMNKFLIGVPLIYIFIAPKKYYGLGLGAEGLALQILIEQVIATNIMLFFITKFLNIKYLNFLKHQIYIILLFLIIGYCSMYICNILIINNYGIIKISFSGVVYIILSSILSFYFPSIFGVTQKEKYIFLNNLKK